MKKIVTLFVILFTLCAFSKPATDNVKNYYGIPDVLTYDKIDYKLVASYHPTDAYYKQEYIPARQSADHYKTMLVIDFDITDSTGMDNLVKTKANELNERKQSDAVCNYHLFKNAAAGEYILDFVLSSSNGSNLDIVERNIYRYLNYTDKAGHSGVLLIGLSQRAYGNDITGFFKSLKETMHDDVDKLRTHRIPQIQLQ